MSDLSPKRPLREGDRAPHFSLRDQHGHEVALGQFRGRPLVVYFYPKDNTPACTAEACTFRDQMQEFHALGAAVVGVSSDSVESHAAFARRFNISFPLLADADGSVRALFGVPKTFGLFPGRTTYVIDADGVIRRVFSSQLQAKRHVEEARQALDLLRQP